MSPGQALVFLAMVDTANRAYWAEWFPCPLRNIALKTGMTPSAVTKAKDALVKKHYIGFRKNGKEVEIKITFESVENSSDFFRDDVEVLSKNRSAKTPAILRVCEG